MKIAVVKSQILAGLSNGKIESLAQDYSEFVESSSVVNKTIYLCQAVRDKYKLTIAKTDEYRQLPIERSSDFLEATTLKIVAKILSAKPKKVAEIVEGDTATVQDTLEEVTSLTYMFEDEDDTLGYTSPGEASEEDVEAWVTEQYRGLGYKNPKEKQLIPQLTQELLDLNETGSLNWDTFCSTMEQYGFDFFDYEEDDCSDWEDLKERIGLA